MLRLPLCCFLYLVRVSHAASGCASTGDKSCASSQELIEEQESREVEDVALELLQRQPTTVKMQDEPTELFAVDLKELSLSNNSIGSTFKCEQDTGGTCHVLDCWDWRGATCSSGSCVCAANECAVAGVCMKGGIIEILKRRCPDYPECGGEYDYCSVGKKCFKSFASFQTNNCPCGEAPQDVVKSFVLDALEECFSDLTEEKDYTPVSTLAVNHYGCTWKDENHEKKLKCVMRMNPLKKGTVCRPLEVASLSYCEDKKKKDGTTTHRRRASTRQRKGAVSRLSQMQGGAQTPTHRRRQTTQKPKSNESGVETKTHNGSSRVVAWSAEMGFQPNFSLNYTTKNMPDTVPGAVELSARVTVDLAATFMISANYNANVSFPIGEVEKVICMKVCIAIGLSFGMRFELSLKGSAKVHARIRRVYRVHAKFGLDMAPGKSLPDLEDNGIVLESDNWVFETSAAAEGIVRAIALPNLTFAGAGASLSLQWPLILEGKIGGHFHLKQHNGSFDDDGFQCYTPKCPSLAKALASKVAVPCDKSKTMCAYCDRDAGDGSLIQLPFRSLWGSAGKVQTAGSVSVSVEMRLEFVVSYTLFDLEAFIGPLRDKCREYLGDLEAGPGKHLDCLVEATTDFSPLDAIDAVCEAELPLSSLLSGERRYTLVTLPLFKLDRTFGEMCPDSTPAPTSGWWR